MEKPTRSQFFHVLITWVMMMTGAVVMISTLVGTLAMIPMIVQRTIAIFRAGFLSLRIEEENEKIALSDDEPYRGERP